MRREELENDTTRVKLQYIVRMGKLKYVTRM